MVGIADAFISGPVYQHAPATPRISGGQTNGEKIASIRVGPFGSRENAVAAKAFKARKSEIGQRATMPTIVCVNSQYVVQSDVIMF